MIMKKIISAVLCLLSAASTFSFAQGTDNDLETDFRGRISVGMDKKLFKGFHVGAEGEVRFTDNFGEIGRYQIGTGLSYKMTSWLKAGLGYVFIENRGSSGTYNPRHRAYADLTGTLACGDFRFSLRERLQYTGRSGVNKYQTNPNSLALKTRAKILYKGFNGISPYAFAEIRFTLNDPACTADWNGTEYSNYEFNGYSDTYLSRLRGGVGLQWKLDAKNSLDFTFMLDYIYTKETDTNKSGTKLKSLTYDRTLAPTFCLGYSFSF